VTTTEKLRAANVSAFGLPNSPHGSHNQMRFCSQIPLHSSWRSINSASTCQRMWTYTSGNSRDAVDMAPAIDEQRVFREVTGIFAGEEQGLAADIGFWIAHAAHGVASGRR